MCACACAHACLCVRVACLAGAADLRKHHPRIVSLHAIGMHEICGKLDRIQIVGAYEQRNLPSQATVAAHASDHFSQSTIVRVVSILQRVMHLHASVRTRASRGQRTLSKG
jgi:hypothetical protein